MAKYEWTDLRKHNVVMRKISKYPRSYKNQWISSSVDRMAIYINASTEEKVRTHNPFTELKRTLKIPNFIPYELIYISFCKYMDTHEIYMASNKHDLYQKLRSRPPFNALEI